VLENFGRDANCRAIESIIVSHWASRRSTA